MYNNVVYMNKVYIFAKNGDTWWIKGILKSKSTEFPMKVKHQLKL